MNKHFKVKISLRFSFCWWNFSIFFKVWRISFDIWNMLSYNRINDAFTTLTKHFIKIMIVNDIKNSLNKFLCSVKNNLTHFWSGFGLRFTNFYDRIYYSFLPQRYVYTAYVETVKCLRCFISGLLPQVIINIQS